MIAFIEQQGITPCYAVTLAQRAGLLKGVEFFISSPMEARVQNTFLMLGQTDSTLVLFIYWY